MLQVTRAYKGGTMVVKVPVNKERISAEEDALITRYVQFLDELNILGDIEVTLEDIRAKFS